MKINLEEILKPICSHIGLNPDIHIIQEHSLAYPSKDIRIVQSFKIDYLIMEDANKLIDCFQKALIDPIRNSDLVKDALFEKETEIEKQSYRIEWLEKETERLNQKILELQKYKDFYTLYKGLKE